MSQRSLLQASTCQFGTHLNEALRDRFFCGLRSKETQKKLLTEEHTFDAALKVALGAEAAEKDVAAFSQESSASVNKVDSGNRRSFSLPNVVRVLASEATSIPLVATLKTPRSV